MKKKRLPSPAIARSLPSGFSYLLGEVKLRIQTAQARAMASVNAELVRLYWDIGRLINSRQKREGWGASVIPRLSSELRNEIPELKGFSERNLKLMVQFAHEYPEAFDPSEAIGQPPVAQLAKAENRQALVAQLPWAHNVLLMQRIKDTASREWYMRQTLANGWTDLELGHDFHETKQGVRFTISEWETILPD